MLSKTLLNNRKRSETPRKSYKRMKNKMFMCVICEFKDIQVCSTFEKTTDLFSLISKYDKIQHIYKRPNLVSGV